MTKLQAVLFDLDGTLLDSARDFHRILSGMLDKTHPALPFELLRPHVSEGARAMVCRAFNASPDDPATLPLVERFLNAYQDNPTASGALFTGIPPLLDWLDLRNIPWGIVTNKSERFASLILAHLELDSRCKTLVCPEHVTHPKPNPEALLLGCRQLNSLPAQTLYIGDHQRDIEAGKNAGMPTIACGYGYIGTDEDPASWQATHLVTDTQELRALLESLL
ncbi:HAD family hydrolase [Marinobacterium litorale]|uniref:HAD family hydrolase n=1 Tax=Marinobacterium litorale TaxID=404770 RepID=UPI000413EC93|nr:HAD-IA family hydrolase [Marinobacterium litorale]